jgi:hypothetical protein
MSFSHVSARAKAYKQNAQKANKFGPPLLRQYPPNRLSRS